MITKQAWTAGQGLNFVAVWILLKGTMHVRQSSGSRVFSFVTSYLNKVS